MGITAPCAFVAPWAAVIIGAVAAVLMLVSVHVVEHRLKIDDPVGASSVHGTAGVWGLLAVGIFADGTYGGVSGIIAGNGSQFVAQLIAAVVAVAWALTTGLLLFNVLKRTVGLRASREEELSGLDFRSTASRRIRTTTPRPRRNRRRTRRPSRGSSVDGKGAGPPGPSLSFQEESEESVRIRWRLVSRLRRYDG